MAHLYSLVTDLTLLLFLNISTLCPMEGETYLLHRQGKQVSIFLIIYQFKLIQSRQKFHFRGENKFLFVFVIVPVPHSHRLLLIRTPIGYRVNNNKNCETYLLLNDYQNSKFYEKYEHIQIN